MQNTEHLISRLVLQALAFNQVTDICQTEETTAHQTIQSDREVNLFRP